MAKHVEELVPQFDELSLEVSRLVFARISHDHLDALCLKETARLFNGPEPMLRVVWTASWSHGNRTDIVILLPERGALTHLERTKRHLAHRLMRELFRIDAELGAAEQLLGRAAA